MPPGLLLAPVGAGKTEFALEQIVATAQAQPFAPIWVLLPTERQKDAFRQRLIERPSGQGTAAQRGVYFNIEFFNFYELYVRLLDMAGKPPRHLDYRADTARFRLLRTVLRGLKRDGQLRVFAQIADKPGFVSVIADFIYELKGNVIPPEVFEAAAATRTEKDRELARIYSAYQSLLIEHNIVDREGQGWVALEAAHKNYDLGADVALLVVDGFDQFTVLQARLVALLASRAQNALLTLTVVPGREGTIGWRFWQAQDRLLTTFLDEMGEELTVMQSATLAVEKRPSPLLYLANQIFHPEAMETQPSAGHLRLIEAPNPTQEVGALLREVKRLLLRTASEGEVRPDDVLIALRDWGRYAAQFAALARSYGVPVALHSGEPLIENPAIIALLDLLALAERDFRRRDLLDTLRSPYFSVRGLGANEVDLLERVSRALLVVGGREAWLDAVRAAVNTPLDEDEPDHMVLTPEQSDHLAAYLSLFFDKVTPLPANSVRDYIVWLEDLIGADPERDPEDKSILPNADSDEIVELIVPDYSLDMIAQLRHEIARRDVPDDWRHGGEDPIVARDLAALNRFKSVLGGLQTAHSLLASLGVDVQGSEPMSWTEFVEDVKAAVSSATVERQPNRAGRVLVTTVANARGLAHRFVCVPGLSEGIFPAPTPEDLLYLDSERATLKQQGIELATQAERAADDSLFYELLSLAKDALILSRPTVQDGAPWPPSHLWQAVRAVYSDTDSDEVLRQVKVGEVVNAEDAASRSEAALAVAADLNSDSLAAGLYNWLVNHHNDYWTHIRRGRDIERGRINGRTGRYSGHIADAKLQAFIRAQLGTGRVWSASQLNDYGVCGFRYFTKRLLKLEALEEPEEGLNNRQRGTIFHEMLERTYRHFQDVQCVVAPENTDFALETLRGIAADVLPNAPARLGFRASPLWQQEQAVILRKLEALVRLDFSDESPIGKKYPGQRIPYALEAPFGGLTAWGLDLMIDGAPETLRLRGQIDRIDVIDGARLVIVDYKSGSTPIKPQEIGDGRNFQMMVYLRAAESLLAWEQAAGGLNGAEVAGGLFWHISSRAVDDHAYLLSESKNVRPQMDAALEHLGQYIADGRVGIFGTTPNKVRDGMCVSYCEFSQFCRISISGGHRSEGDDESDG